MSEEEQDWSDVASGVGLFSSQKPQEARPIGLRELGHNPDDDGAANSEHEGSASEGSASEGEEDTESEDVDNPNSDHERLAMDGLEDLILKREPESEPEDYYGASSAHYRLAVNGHKGPTSGRDGDSESEDEGSEYPQYKQEGATNGHEGRVSVGEEDAESEDDSDDAEHDERVAVNGHEGVKTDGGGESELEDGEESIEYHDGEETAPLPASAQGKEDKSDEEPDTSGDEVSDEEATVNSERDHFPTARRGTNPDEDVSMTPPSMLRMAEKRKRQDEENNHSESPNHKRRRVVQNGGSYGATRDVYDHPSSPDGESSSPSRARSLSSSGKRRQRAKPTFSQSQSTSKGKGKEPEKPPPLMNRFFSRLFSSQPASSKAAPPNPFSSQPPLSNASSSKATSSQPSLSRASSSKVPPLQPSLSRASFSDAPPARASSSETSSSQASSSEASSSQASPSQPSLPNASTSQASPLEPLSVKVSPSKAASSQAPALKVPPSNPSSSRPPPTNVGASSSRTRIFTPEETERITVAVETYRDKHNMTQREVNDLIQKGLGVGRTVVDTELKKFWSLVTATCSGKPRQKVIDFCRMRFHNFKARGGHWTPEEEEQLAQLVAQGGTKWAKWSLVMNRHPRDLRDRYRNYIICGSNRASDRWAPEEEEMFKMHVHEALEALEREKAAKPDNSFYDRPLDQLIDWQEISRRLGRTRSRLQCMSKWKKLQRRAEST